jgi:hypothetical protein
MVVVRFNHFFGVGCVRIADNKNRSLVLVDISRHPK